MTADKLPISPSRRLHSLPRSSQRTAMLRAWVDFAYRIRLDCKTPGVLGELTILSTAQPTDSFEKG
jgi:hypothetical protein